MSGTFPRLVLFGVALITLAQCVRAQTEKWKIDAGHSHATFLLISSRAPNEPRVAGIARTSGLATLNSEDRSKIALRMSVYPEGEGETLLTADDTLRPDALASLAFYSVLSFHSDRTVVIQKGHLELSGELTLTHVTRASTAAWSNSYSGSRYADPDKKTFSRDVTLTLLTSGEAIEAGEKVGLLRLEFITDISREEFPELWTSLPDSIWPAVVDDRNCTMPALQVDLRDYRGSTCTGTAIDPAIVRTDFASQPEGKPGAAARARSGGDKVRIVFQFRLTRPG
jgi:polyisoprenoid-binding protein YceI